MVETITKSSIERIRDIIEDYRWNYKDLDIDKCVAEIIELANAVLVKEFNKWADESIHSYKSIPHFSVLTSIRHENKIDALVWAKKNLARLSVEG